MIAEPVMVEVPMPEEIQERYLEVRDVTTGEVVTRLELIISDRAEGDLGMRKNG